MSWRRRRWPFGGPWDEEFGEAFEMMDRLMREVQSGNLPEGAWYYGYQVTTGPDGKPVVKEFGNLHPDRRGALPQGTREPLVDVSVDDAEKTVKVVVEMPGADKESITVNATERSLSVTSNSGGKPYSAEVPLPCEVEPGTADASYTNGILEVVLRQKGQDEPKGVNVKVR